jgi:hypothetical protein
MGRDYASERVPFCWPRADQRTPGEGISRDRRRRRYRRGEPAETGPERYRGTLVVVCVPKDSQWSLLE